MKQNVLVFFVLVLLIPSSLFGIEKGKRFGVELNSGVSIATKKLSGITAYPGLNFEGLVHYNLVPQFGIYGGWGWNHFGVGKSFIGPDGSFEETGYLLGVQYKQPFGNSPVSGYLRLAGLFNHIETENSEGEIISDTKYGFGYQVATGVEISLGEKWSLTPGLKFNHLKRDSKFDGVLKTLDHNYISLRIGLVRYF